ncbi:hypothetical protein ACFFX0_19830 [Citricoccus parietis]|uniref:Uncharacterized protein n=1 Tax=Citricoccus parietis TaxID=592307 RepID=A0ABV5G3U4_9MICC
MTSSRGCGNVAAARRVRRSTIVRIPRLNPAVQEFHDLATPTGPRVRPPGPAPDRRGIDRRFGRRRARRVLDLPYFE